MRTKLTTFFLIVSAILSSTLSAQDVPKFAHVDREGLVFYFLENEKADERLQKLEDEVQNYCKIMDDELVKMSKDLQSNSFEMDEQAISDKGKELNQLEERLQTYKEVSLRDFNELKKKLYEGAKEKVGNAIKMIAKEHGISYVFDAKTLPYKDENMQDISTEVAGKLGFLYPNSAWNSLNIPNFYEDNYDLFRPKYVFEYW